MNEHSKLSGLDAVLVKSRTLSLIADLAEEREVRRSEVAKVSNLARLRKDKEVERRRYLLIPFPVEVLAK